MLMHVAIIMDGNGRWAKERGLPRIEGHRKGAEKAEKVVEWAADLGVNYISLYAFSTENWKRPWDEVRFLFNLFVSFVKRKVQKMKDKGVRIKIMGRREGLPEEVLEVWDWVEKETKNGERMTVVIALNYGGRAEILDAVNKILKDGIEKVDEESFRKYLYIPELPDPDLVIRTSGEMRISNFLLWQIAYSELVFIKKYWPDFEKEDLIYALEEFSKRQRRFGGI
ncbi:MAG: di-trans,poly-cis-decaprenylcistransferase [Thermotogaceae bacterium]|nr:di-trans,poly-cis-decaprenylcistransferase [Thermotogaceae bacterium]